MDGGMGDFIVEWDGKVNEDLIQDVLLIVRY
jgi:hypothetical protein